MSKVVERVQGSVKFSHFQAGELWYSCFDGWKFPVPIEDTVNAQGGQPRFEAEDKGIIFMRWIRKQIAVEGE